MLQWLLIKNGVTVIPPNPIQSNPIQSMDESQSISNSETSLFPPDRRRNWNKHMKCYTANLGANVLSDAAVSRSLTSRDFERAVVIRSRSSCRPTPDSPSERSLRRCRPAHHSRRRRRAAAATRDTAQPPTRARRPWTAAATTEASTAGLRVAELRRRRSVATRVGAWWCPTSPTKNRWNCDRRQDDEPLC